MNRRGQAIIPPPFPSAEATALAAEEQERERLERLEAALALARSGPRGEATQILLDAEHEYRIPRAQQRAEDKARLKAMEDRRRYTDGSAPATKIHVMVYCSKAVTKLAVERKRMANRFKSALELICNRTNNPPPLDPGEWNHVRFV